MKRLFFASVFCFGVAANAAMAAAADGLPHQHDKLLYQYGRRL